MSKERCVLCGKTTDDKLQLGEKITYRDITAHYFCLLLTSNLSQHGEENQGIYGFLPKHIKSEVNRTSKLNCFYCRQKCATIGCCIRACRRSFHLPCALKNDCRLEFSETFASYCDLHHGIEKPDQVHKSTDLCTICYDEMGEYNPIQSIQSPCCNKDSWYHKMCLMKYAQASGYFLKCPLCNDSDSFRQSIAKKGVFIPDRDAEWEETGSNGFYNFEEHTQRSTRCAAKKCKCPRGRKYDSPDEDDNYSFLYCHYCGSSCVHRACTIGDLFLCDECSIVTNDNDDSGNRSQQSSDSEIGDSDATDESIRINPNLLPPRGQKTASDSSSSDESTAASGSEQDVIYTYKETTFETDEKTNETNRVTRRRISFPIRDLCIPLTRVTIPSATSTSSSSSSSRQRKMYSEEETDSDATTSEQTSSDEAKTGHDAKSTEESERQSEDQESDVSDIKPIIRNKNLTILSSESGNESDLSSIVRTRSKRSISSRKRNLISDTECHESDSRDINENSAVICSKSISNDSLFTSKDLSKTLKTEYDGNIVRNYSTPQNKGTKFETETDKSSSSSDEVLVTKPKRSRRSSRVSFRIESSHSSSSTSSDSTSMNDDVEEIKPVRKRKAIRIASTSTCTSSNTGSSDDTESTISLISSSNLTSTNTSTESEDSSVINLDSSDIKPDLKELNSSSVTKRKRTIVDYMHGSTTSSSDDEKYDVKPPLHKMSRKVTPRKRPHSFPNRPVNQLSIKEMFQSWNKSI